MTGRGMGLCAGRDVPGFMNPYGPRGGRGYGRGFGGGRGRGFGRGRGRRFRASFWPEEDIDPMPAYEPGAWRAPSQEDQKAYLEDLRKSLEQELEDIRRRLEELSAATDE